MIEAFGEQLITIDELRARMPDLRARETNLLCVTPVAQMSPATTITSGDRLIMVSAWVGSLNVPGCG